MTNPVYVASVYTREVTYTNLLGETKTVTLSFSLDPLLLLRVISTYSPKKVKSGNPALNGRNAEITEEEQLRLIHDLACKAAGQASLDGERWIPWEDFSEDIAGKAFLTKLTSSDEDRKEFAKKVIMDPFRAFVGFAKADPSNSAAEMTMFDKQLEQMENIFKAPAEKVESDAEKRARLQAEMDALSATPELPSNVTPLPPQ